MEAKDWITIASIFSTLLIATLTLISNRRKEALQQKRDDKLRKEQQAREDVLRKEQQAREDALRAEQQRHEAERKKKERTHQPRIEFSINCNFYGPHEDSYIVEFLLTADNKGLVQQTFENMHLRVRGIESNQPLTYLADYEPRLSFPIKLIDKVSVIPTSYESFFVEPGGRLILLMLLRCLVQSNTY